MGVNAGVFPSQSYIWPRPHWRALYPTTSWYVATDSDQRMKPSTLQTYERM